ncbi:right-handed parallel beta-helix repeat-containing protein [Cellulophaga sp. Z1A5H]|uniref:right-handed parallel beta-helix repeat-containing protein n=1 Tax=Cellulophaga sp. Z1A5H TaxID=2687291 RepID=UPI0013FDD497|nr:right-handed parallel beta-helix repeat-containing protein [Cellulophaga sp. Z1A5H]
MKLYFKLICLLVFFSQIGLNANNRTKRSSNKITIKKETNQQSQPVYFAANLKEFLDALGANRTIIITNDIYIKEELNQVVTDTSKFFMKQPNANGIGGQPKYNNEFYAIEGAYWSSVATKESLTKNNFSEFIKDEIKLVVKKAHNLTIMTNNSSSIIMTQSEDEVISFEDLTNFTLLNLSIFHEIETDGGCGEFAPVIAFKNATHITVDNCKLNGSGTEGIHTNNVNGLTVVNTDVFNCNKRGFSFEKSKGIIISNCTIYSNTLTNSPSIFYLIESEVQILKTSITSNTSDTSAPMVYKDDKSTITFKECYIAENTNFTITPEIMAGTIKNPVEISEKEGIYTPYKNYFVNAKSGLNYRATPKGKIVGKFPINTKVTVIKYTKVFDEITDDGKVLKGEWVGIQQKTDTVYVFNSFLSSSPTDLELKIYELSPYYKEENGDTRTAFVNLSDTYFSSIKYDNMLLNQEITSDTIVLNLKQRALFLKKINISDADTIFIYEIENDTVYSYNVKNLPLIACVNIYVGASENESDFEFGFDLGKLTINYSNFVYVGKENPFQTKQLKPMVWKTIANKDFPIKFDAKVVNKDIRSWFDGVIPEKSYIFKDNNYNYFIQNLERDGSVNYRYMVVLNATSNELIFSDVLIDSEGSYLIPLNTEDNENAYNEIQWSGALFKDKPVVTFGYEGYSFGCPSITLISKTAPPISILCDNRH